MDGKKIYLGSSRKKFNKKFLFLIPLIFIALYFIRGPFIAREHIQKGQVALEVMKFGEADYEIRRALASQPWNKEAKKLAEVLKKELQIRNGLNNGRVDEAISAAEAYFAGNKNERTLNLLLLSLAVKDKDTATARYKKENIKSPLGDDMVRGFNARSGVTKDIVLAKILSENSFPSAALPIAILVTKKNEKYRDAFLVLASIHYQLGDNTKAIDAANKAITIDAFYYKSYEFLADLYKSLGNTVEEKKARQRATELNLGD